MHYLFTIPSNDNPNGPHLFLVHGDESADALIDALDRAGISYGCEEMPTATLEDVASVFPAIA